MQKTTIKTPHAAMIVWNYQERLSSSAVSYDKLHAVDHIIISTASIISIDTVKSKSSPAGGFTVVLAPTKNWITVLTPGSWVVLLMSQNPIAKTDLPQYEGQADPNKVKFLGRIESTRVNVTVDAETGARRTQYIVTGSDWGNVFQTHIYVDPAARDPESSVVGQAIRLLYDQYLTSNVDFENWLTSTANVTTIKNFWGTSNTSNFLKDLAKKLKGDLTKFGDKMVIKSNIVMRLPDSLSRYFNYFGRQKSTCNIASLIRVIAGSAYRTTGNNATKDNIYFDAYADSQDGFWLLDPSKLLGQHTAWELINEASNEVINEVICDLRWTMQDDGSLQPMLALYKRVRPFVLRNHGGSPPTDKNGKVIKESDEQKARREGWNQLSKQNMVSKFYNLRTVKIPIEDIINVDAGTNWRDKLNFIEMMPDTSNLIDTFKPTSDMNKISAQEFDEGAFSREGFRAKLATSVYIPVVTIAKTKKPDPFALRIWKYLLREWYFNTHLLLNGTMTIMGQNNYIQVGDNIMFDSRVVGLTPNMSAAEIGQASTTDDNSVYILAHVENVKHTFSVTNEGARMFRTTIDFIRGAIVDANRNPMTPKRAGLASDGRLDKSTTNMEDSDKINSTNIFGESSAGDPNPGKLPGSEDIS